MQWNDPNSASAEESAKFDRYIKDLGVMIQSIPAEDGTAFLSALIHVTALGFLHAYQRPQTPGLIGAVTGSIICSASGTASGDPGVARQMAEQLIKNRHDPLGGEVARMPKFPGRKDDTNA
jgi:hypothetical protein